MLGKHVLLTLLAACGVHSNPQADGPPDTEQPDGHNQETVHDQHFCCHSVDQKNLTGDGCNTIASTQIDKCDKVLYCAGNWSKDEGHVVCE
jgi:hypothetical protein